MFSVYYLGYFVLIIITAPLSYSVLLTPDDIPRGRCVWYDQCGPGFNPETWLNCPATKETRDGPYMKDALGLKILKRLCPNIYKGDSSTRTCCSVSQLKELDRDMALPQQLLPRCPSCLENFLNLFCQINCGLNQADFVWPNMSHSYPYGYHHIPKGIPAVTILLTHQYAEGFYNSCKDVQMPSAKDKAISMFCGVKAEKCTAFKLLNYMGSISNGRAAFESDYLLKDKNTTMPDNKTLTPLNATNIPCNVTSNLSMPCLCQDCTASCCLYSNSRQDLGLHPTTQIGYFHSQFRPNFRRSQLIISRPDNHTKVNHPYPPPSIESVNFTSLFGLEFLHEVLKLQTNITTLHVPYKGEVLSFTDICYKPAEPQNEDCAVESVLQYWQNNGTNLDKVVMDEYQLFDLADYFDHYLSCTSNPYAENDMTKLFLSCRADTGAVMKPMNILGGYDGVNYQNATQFVISFYLNTTDDGQRAKADAWEKAVYNYTYRIAHCPSLYHMAISYWP